MLSIDVLKKNKKYSEIDFNDNIERTRFEDCHFQEVKFIDISFNDVEFKSCKFEHCDFVDCNDENIDHLDFYDCIISYCDFINFAHYGCYFENNSFEVVDFINSEFTFAIFQSNSFLQVRFIDRCILEEVSFYDSWEWFDISFLNKNDTIQLSYDINISKFNYKRKNDIELGYVDKVSREE